MTKDLLFKNEQGKMLAAKLEEPEGEPRAFAIFAHCFGCSKDVLATTRISRALTKEGIAVLRFDFQGLGASEGDFSETTFSSNVSDIVYAGKYLRENYKAPELIIGHSLGGAMSIVGASLIPEIKAVCTIAAPSYPSHVVHLFEEHLDKIQKEGSVTINFAGRQLTITKDYLQDIRSHNLEGILRHFGKAILIFHSPIDLTVSIDHARNIYKAARHPKSFISLDNADHFLANRDDAEFVATVLAAWSKRYVGR
ncbi:MAG: alpha/beta hydrolase family protein [Alphaproteobacteria bacterium]